MVKLGTVNEVLFHDEDKFLPRNCESAAYLNYNDIVDNKNSIFVLKSRVKRSFTKIN